MKTAFIFHGTEGYPEENWFPWLKTQLEKLAYEVYVPQFPTPEGQTPEVWFEVLDLHKNKINKDTVIFGHSLGGSFLLRVLEKHKINTAFFIATPVGILPIQNIETDKPFLENGFDWGKIRNNANNFAVIHSDFDTFMTIENGEELAKQLGVEFIQVEGGGHLNASAGYTELPLLLEKFKDTL